MKTLESKNSNPIIPPIFFIGFILLAMVSRFVLPPFLGHPENFSPIDATALFSGAYLGRKWMAFLIPLVSVWVSDLVINYEYFHNWVWFYPGFFWQYGFYLAVVLFSSYLFRNPESRISIKVPLASVGVSIAFFMVSNFGFWAGSVPYPHTFAGLMLCYAAGIPFFRSTFISDLVFSGILFFGMQGVISLSRKYFLKLQ